MELYIPNIDYLNVLYKISFTHKEGKIIRRQIEENVPSLARLYGYLRTFLSFQDLVQHHLDVNSPLRRMLISNDFIVISADQKVPYSLREFKELLKETSLRGLRVLPEVSQGKLVFQDPPFWKYTNNTARFCLRDNIFHMFSAEWSTEHHPMASFNMELFTMKKDPLPLDMEIVESYFDEDFVYKKPRLYFLSAEDTFLWDIFFKYKNKDCVLLLPLNDFGDYSFTDADYAKFVYVLSFFTNELGNIVFELINYTHSSDRITDGEPFETAWVTTEMYLEIPDYQFPSKEEAYSYYGLMIQVQEEPKALGLETRFLNLHLDSYYCCVDTGSSVLCLVSDQQQQSTNEFQVINTKFQYDFWFHDVTLL